MLCDGKAKPSTRSAGSASDGDAGPANLAELVQNELHVRVNDGGTSLSIPAVQAVLRSHIQSAIAGDVAAQRSVMALAGRLLSAELACAAEAEKTPPVPASLGR